MSSEEHSHVIPFKLLIRTFATLLVLTVVTVLTAMVDFGSFNKYTNDLIDLSSLNIVFAVLIALVKAGLVVTFFMGLKFDKKMNIGILFGNMVFLFIFFVLCITDVKFRDVNDKYEGHKLYFESQVEKYNKNPIHHGSAHGDSHGEKESDGHGDDSSH